MIREDLENKITSNCGRFFIIPVDKITKILRIKSKDEDAEQNTITKLLQRIMQNGGDMVNLETGDVHKATIKVVKKWRVNNQGQNDAVIELRPAKSNSNRFLLKHEMTAEEYIKSRFKETGSSFDPHLCNQFSKEYQELTKS
jgi:hypothetical protein